jgi:hypothetical protein
VVGEPGVGESRLFWEFLRAPRPQPWLVLESTSVSYGQATAYRPVIDLLRAGFPIDACDDARRVREQVVGKVLSLDRALEAALPPLLSLLDIASEIPPGRGSIRTCAARAHWKGAGACCCAKHKCSRCCWCSKTCNGPSRRPRRCSKTGWTACPAPACCWSTLVASTNMAGLARLQAAEFPYETALYLEPEYTFRHALTHEVAYGSLSQERRRVLHAGIVQTIQREHACRLDEHVEALAQHAFRGELWDQAARFLAQAAAKAVARSANREVLALFE